MNKDPLQEESRQAPPHPPPPTSDKDSLTSYLFRAKLAQDKKVSKGEKGEKKMGEDGARQNNGNKP
jgi:hypothetical protein